MCCERVKFTCASTYSVATASCICQAVQALHFSGCQSCSNFDASRTSWLSCSSWQISYFYWKLLKVHFLSGNWLSYILKALVWGWERRVVLDWKLLKLCRCANQLKLCQALQSCPLPAPSSPVGDLDSCTKWLFQLKICISKWLVQMSNSKSAPLPSLPRMLTLNNPQMTWPDPQAAEKIEQNIGKNWDMKWNVKQHRQRWLQPDLLNCLILYCKYLLIHTYGIPNNQNMKENSKSLEGISI